MPIAINPASMTAFDRSGKPEFFLSARCRLSFDFDVEDGIIFNHGAWCWFDGQILFRIHFGVFRFCQDNITARFEADKAANR
jgi:hypothetical protein